MFNPLHKTDSLSDMYHIVRLRRHFVEEVKKKKKKKFKTCLQFTLHYILEFLLGENCKQHNLANVFEVFMKVVVV